MVKNQGNGLSTWSCQLPKKHQEMKLKSEKYVISAKEVMKYRQHSEAATRMCLQ